MYISTINPFLAQLSLVVVWAMPTVATVWSAVSNENVPFALVVASTSALPAQGFLNAILFVILLGRARKRLERTVSVLGTDYGKSASVTHTHAHTRTHSGCNSRFMQSHRFRH